LAGSGAVIAAAAGVEEEPKLKPEGLAAVDPKEKFEADGPLGDPLAGTAAPKENAVDGEVEGGLAPKEKLKDLAGVEFESTFGSSGLDGVVVDVDEPKLNGFEGLLCSFSFSACGAGAAAGVSVFFSVVVGAPKVKGDDPELED
jgi:hypothetical protein